VITQVIRTSLISLGLGFMCQLGQAWFGSQYFDEFLRANLINIQIALLAVNSATMGIVLTKIRDLVDKHGHGEAFKKSRDQFLLSIKEQVALLVASIIVLTVSQSTYVTDIPLAKVAFGSTTAAIFVYSIQVLYDTAKSVLVIIDYSDNEGTGHEQ